MASVNATILNRCKDEKEKSAGIFYADGKFEA
jgi:hypothetical protein